MNMNMNMNTHMNMNTNMSMLPALTWEPQTLSASHHGPGATHMNVVHFYVGLDPLHEHHATHKKNPRICAWGAAAVTHLACAGLQMC